MSDDLRLDDTTYLLNEIERAAVFLASGFETTVPNE